MKRVLFITNLPSPYRVDFFNCLSQYCDLTVCYERKVAAGRNAGWTGIINRSYKEVFLDCTPIMEDSSIGLGVIKEIRKQNFDVLFLTNYSSPSIFLAVLYCRAKKIPYIIEYDGGFNVPSSFLKKQVKRLLLAGATVHMTTSHDHKQYLISLGIRPESIVIYPFSSVLEKEIINKPVSDDEKRRLKESLHLSDKKTVIAVGRFIQVKGFDTLLEAIPKVKEDADYLLIGGTSCEEYKTILAKHGIQNVRFIDFMSKETLFKYYQAADVFVLPTRHDFWGLVINEAMANGLPIITTYQCVAGKELIKNGYNGYLVNPDDKDTLSEKINTILSDDVLRKSMAEHSIEVIRGYSIETMASAHKTIVTEGISSSLVR